MVPRFNPATNRIINTTVVYIMRKWHYLLYPGDWPRIQGRVREWSDSINEKMGFPAGTQHCFGFIDGTARPIARPTGHDIYQESVYDGHHRMHAFDYQAVSCPKGIIRQLFGPVSGRHPDTFMVRESGILKMIKHYCWDKLGHQYWLYADAGYHSSPCLLAPHDHPVPRSVQARMNYIWSKERVAAELIFGRILNLLQTLDFHRMQKVKRSLVGLWYPVCVLLTNCETAMYGNIVGDKYDQEPEGLENYLVEPDKETARWLLNTYGPDPDKVPLFNSEDWFDKMRAANARYNQLSVTERVQL